MTEMMAKSQDNLNVKYALKEDLRRHLKVTLQRVHSFTVGAKITLCVQ